MAAAAAEPSPQQAREQASAQVAQIVTDEIPIIDMDAYLRAASEDSPSEAGLLECKKVMESFHRFGILLIRDPRVNMRDNDEYIDLMEEYFADVGDRFYAN